MNCPKCGLPKFFGIGGYAGPQCLCDITVGPIVTVGEVHKRIILDDPLYQEGYKAGAASRDAEIATLRELKQLYQTERDQLRKQVALLRETVISAKRMIAHPDNIAILEKALADTEPKK